MKSERRHELQHNEWPMAVSRASRYNSIRTHPVAVVVVFASLFGYWWYSSTTAHTHQGLGRRCCRLEPESRPLDQRHRPIPRHHAAQMATLISGDSASIQAVNCVFPTGRMRMRIQKAAKAYADSSTQGDSASMQERAAYGLRECKRRAEISIRPGSYKSIPQKWPTAPMPARLANNCVP